MKLMNHARAQVAPVVGLLALGPVLGSCAVTPDSAFTLGRDYNTLNPIGVQTGRLTVVALDFNDGGPLTGALVDIVGSYTANEPNHYRRTAFSNRFGMVTFNDVPRVVDVTIQHARGLYIVESYPVPQVGTWEFRVYVETVAPRGPDEAL